MTMLGSSNMRSRMLVAPTLRKVAYSLMFRVTDDHVQPSEAAQRPRGAARPGVDDRPAPRRRGGDTFPDVLGPLAKAEHRATSGLENLARPAVDLPAHEERTSTCTKCEKSSRRLVR